MADLHVEIDRLSEENDLAKEQLDAQHKQMQNDIIKIKKLEDEKKKGAFVGSPAGIARKMSTKKGSLEKTASNSSVKLEPTDSGEIIQLKEQILMLTEDKNMLEEEKVNIHIHINHTHTYKSYTYI